MCLWRSSLCLCLSLSLYACPVEEGGKVVSRLLGSHPPVAIEAHLYSQMKSAFTAEMSGFAERERFFTAVELGEWGVRVPEGYALDVRLGTMTQLHPPGSFGAEAASRGGPYGGGAQGPGFLVTVQHLETGFCAQITESGAQRLARGEECGVVARAPVAAVDSGRRKTDDGRRKTDAGRRMPDAGRRMTDDGRRMPDAGRRTTDAGRRMPDAGRRTTGDGIRTTGDGRHSKTMPEQRP